MIHGVVLGGLGNQLFKIFATIAYSIEYNQPFFFFYTTTVNGRKTYWEDFLCKLKKYTVSSYGGHEFFGAKCKGDPANYMKENFIQIGTFHHHYEKLPPAEPNKNYSIQYYLQSYKYFEKHEQNIYDMIGWHEQRENVRSKYSHYFSDSSDMITVSIHFRLGDYKNVQNCHNLLPISYYKLAIKEITSRMNVLFGDNSRKIRFLYFYEHEDKNDVNAFINSIRTIECATEFVSIDTNIADWEQMLLMSCCHSNIIANSTFSWWGAYSNTNKDKIVCYPSIWFGPVLSHNKIDDMFPENWTKIQNFYSDTNDEVQK